MASGKSGRERSAQQERERARVYQARQQLFSDQQRRRVRDNWIAGIVAAVVVAGAIAGQAAYYSAGPGAPTPEPTPSPSPSVSSSTEPIPGPTTTP